MRSTRYIVLSILMAAFFASCSNDASTESEAAENKVVEKTAEKKAEDAKENSYNYLENVDVNEVSYSWQKNLFWFVARNFTR